MGGQALYMDWNTSNFTIASLEDEIKALSRYVDAIVARVHKHEDLIIMKEHSEVPIINGLSNLYHPCQALADLMTIKEYFGELEGLNICYLGDGNDICHFLINGAGHAGINISIACPQNYLPNPEILEAVQRNNNIRIRIGSDSTELVKDADIIYTDTWISMAIWTLTDNSNEKDLRIKAFSDFQVNRELLSHAPEHALVMHCLPAHREYEITADALNSENSIVFDQAENRKHVQKYLMPWILETI